MATTTVPITIHPDVAARIAELAMEREFQQMLDHTREAVPGLRAIEVELLEDPCDHHLTLLIASMREDSGPVDDPTDSNWGAWFVRAFPPEVVQHFIMHSFDEEPDAR
jgi:hypothetical protein